MELELYLLTAEEKMEESINQYSQNLSRITAGRVNPKILDTIRVNYYETMTPIIEIASISIPEPTQLLVNPYDKNVHKQIYSTLAKSNLGAQVSDEGNKIRLKFPELTTERRKELVKSLSTYTEQAKITIRSARQDGNKKIKNDEELNEDDIKYFQDEMQKLTNKYIDKIQTKLKEKEKSLMTI